MYVTQGLKRAAQCNRNGISTFCRGRERTWKESQNRVARLASGLRSLGVKADDRVAVLSLNSDRYFEMYYAIPWSASIVVPINYRLSPKEIAYTLQDSGATVLCVDEDLCQAWQQLKSQVPQVKHVIYMGDGEAPAGMTHHEALIEENAPIPDTVRGYNDIYGLFYTGGTTGKAKGVMLTHSNICANALPVIGNMNYTPQTRYLHAAPMFHVADCGSTFGLTQTCGAHFFHDKFHPETILKQIQDEKISALMLVPTMLNMVVHHPNFYKYDLSCLTDIIYGASPMPEALIRRLLTDLPSVRFTQCLGMTEMSPVITCLYPHQHVLDGPESIRLRSVGQVAYNVEVRIADEEDRELPPGTLGQILIRGTPLMKGYWNQPQLSAEALKDGWLHSGDAGYMDDDGFIFVVDRVKDMIISGGENVYSTEVESTLSQHPAVKECAIIGLPHELWGEAVHAVIVLKDGCTASEEELIEYCKEAIASYKCPRTVEFRLSSLPLSGAGKVLKTQLRQDCLSSPSAQ